VDADETAGTASARSYFTVLQSRPDLPLQPIVAGRYEGAFARDVDDRWGVIASAVASQIRGAAQ
jgi:hypothetical protein